MNPETVTALTEAWETAKAEFGSPWFRVRTTYAPKNETTGEPGAQSVDTLTFTAVFSQRRGTSPEDFRSDASGALAADLDILASGDLVTHSDHGIFQVSETPPQNYVVYERAEVKASAANS